MSKDLNKLAKMNNMLASSHSKRKVYEGFFSVEEYVLSYQKFDKEQSAVVTRSALISSAIERKVL